MPRPVDEKVMTVLERGAQGVVDSVVIALDGVKAIEELTPQDVKFFERCLISKLTDVLTERGLM